MADFIDRIVDKHRSSFTLDKARSFVGKLKSDVVTKAVAGASPDDPDVVRVLGCIVCIRLLLERLDAEKEPEDGQ